MVIDWIFGLPRWELALIIGIAGTGILWLIGKIVTAKTKGTTDDFVVRTSGRHLFLATLAVSIYFALKDFGYDTKWTWPAFLTSQILNVGWWVIRLSFLLIEAASERIRMNAKNRALGFAIPLIVRASMLFSLFSCAMALVWIWTGYDGFELSLTVLGALSFLLAFVFQEPLQNLFGGVSLLMDSPFEYGDLIILDDGKTYRVDRTGARVTQLYDIKEHTHAYVPNVSLGNQTIVNITHPDTELRDVISIGVAYGSDLTKAQEILIQLASRHPNILSAANTNADQLLLAPEFRDLEAFERERLGYDAVVRENTEELLRRLILVTEYARRAEAHSLTKDQRVSLSTLIENSLEQLSDIALDIARWLQFESYLDVLYTIRRSNNPLLEKSARDMLDSAPQNCQTLRDALMNDQPVSGEMVFRSGLVPAMLEFGGTLGKADCQPIASVSLIEETSAKLSSQISNIDAYHEINRHFLMWRRRIQMVRMELVTAQKYAVRRGANDYLVHTHVNHAVQNLIGSFKLRVPGQQFPSVDLLEFGSSTVDLRLEYFVDNIAGEHFKRRERVRSEMIVAIEKSFAEAGIEMPYPHIQVITGE